MVKYSVDSFSINDINKGKVILVDKPLNWTSFDVVKYIRCLLYTSPSPRDP